MASSAWPAIRRRRPPWSSPPGSSLRWSVSLMSCHSRSGRYGRRAAAGRAGARGTGGKLAHPRRPGERHAGARSTPDLRGSTGAGRSQNPQLRLEVRLLEGWRRADRAAAAGQISPQLHIGFTAPPACSSQGLSGSIMDRLGAPLQIGSSARIPVKNRRARPITTIMSAWEASRPEQGHDATAAVDGTRLGAGDGSPLQSRGTVGSVMPACGRVPAPEDGAGDTRITRRDSRGMTRKILFGATDAGPACGRLRRCFISGPGRAADHHDHARGRPGGRDHRRRPARHAARGDPASGDQRPGQEGRGRRSGRSRRPRPTRPTAEKPKDKAKEETSPGEFLEEDEPAKPKRKKRERTKPGDIRTPDGAPTARQPDTDTRPPRSRAGRRSELRHQQVPHPAVPASDLPGRRHAVRHPLGGPRGDQRDRDRLRPQPERVLRRRARVDAVHPVVVARIRNRREQRRREGPVQPRRRDLRRRPLPEGRRRRAATCAARSSRTTTPTGTSTR